MQISMKPDSPSICMSITYASREGSQAEVNQENCRSFLPSSVENPLGSDTVPHHHSTAPGPLLSSQPNTQTKNKPETQHFVHREMTISAKTAIHYSQPLALHTQPLALHTPQLVNWSWNRQWRKDDILQLNNMNEHPRDSASNFVLSNHFVKPSISGYFKSWMLYGSPLEIDLYNK